MPDVLEYFICCERGVTLGASPNSDPELLPV